MHVAILTAGGAGMFCGSCMHDNTWARALQQAGVEVSLIPLYTPLRLDEENLSSSPIFLGGINVYLNHHSRLWRTLPTWLTRWVNSPTILNWATKRGVSNDARELGELSVATLQGEMGPQAREIDELATFLGDSLRPDVLIFTNSLLSGLLRRIRSRFSGRVFCTLQGDDIFLNQLVEPYHSRCLNLIHERASEFDGFLAHSDYYADFMATFLSVNRDHIHRLPLTIDCRLHEGTPQLRTGTEPLTVGYFARIAPEKGLKELVLAFLKVHARLPNTRLVAGGYLGPNQRSYFEEVQKLAKPLGRAFQYLGSPDDWRGKVAFLKTLDVFSVPAPYHEPKGLYVLEALANGVPVVQPNHGAFPELLASTGGGLTVASCEIDSLADGLMRLLTDHSLRYEFAVTGHRRVREGHDLTNLASATMELLQTEGADSQNASR